MESKGPGIAPELSRGFAASKRDTYLRRSPEASDNGNFVGKTPAELTISEMRELGHPETPLRAIRRFCLGCAGSSAEVRKCVCSHCELWPMRLGRNPFHGLASLAKPEGEA